MTRRDSREAHAPGSIIRSRDTGMDKPDMTDEDVIRERIGQLVEAIRAMDGGTIERIYAADIVSFDVEPPLKHVGVAHKLENWEGIFARFHSPLEYDVCDLAITTSGDIAFAHSFNRIGGTMKDGTRTDHWIRCTNCFRKIDGEWRIAHDHVSVPFELG